MHHRILSWCRPTAVLTAAMAAASAVTAPAAAGPHSDLFQPDVFGTEGALEKRTHGLVDPDGRHCPLASNAVSLNEAIDLALCRNPSTRAAWAAARQQAAALGGAESAWLPTVSGTASESRDLEGQHADALGQIVPGAQNTKDAAITLSWTIYDFGNRSSHIKSARSLLDASAATLNRTSQQLVFAVVQGYFGAVAADESLAAAKTTEDVASRTAEIAKGLQAGGADTLADVLQADTAYDQAVLTRLQAEATAKSAHGQLANVLGWDADQPLKLAPEPVPVQVKPLSARMSDLMAEAARQRPDLAAALAQRDAAEANVSIARATGRPSISFQGGREISDTTSIPNQNYSQIGIYVTVPIFTGFNVGYNVRQAQAALSGQESNAEQVRLNVSLDVWNGYYALDSAIQQLAATTNLTNTALKNEEVALGRFQSGVGTIIEMLTAQGAAATARQLRINAELGWNTGRAQLALALGRLTSAEPLTDLN